MVMSNNNRIRVNKSVITRASKLLECRIRDALRQHFSCHCNFYWVTAPLPVLKGKAGTIIIEVDDSGKTASGNIELNLQGELKIVITETEHQSFSLQSVDVEKKTTIRLQ